MITNDPKAPPGHKYHLLIVAPTLDHRLLIQYALLTSIPWVRGIFATTIEEALDYLKSCLNYPVIKPSLVLLELSSQTNERSWSLLAQVKHLFPSLPLIGLSAALAPEIIERAYALGSNAVMAVPTSLPGWEQQFRTLGAYWFNAVVLPPG